MNATVPHIVIRHTDGEFAGRLEHFFPAKNGAGFYELADGEDDRSTKDVMEALALVRKEHLSIRMCGNLTGAIRMVPAGDIQCL